MNTTRRFFLALAIAALGSAVCGAGPAAADYLAYTGNFTGAGSTNGPFVKPTSIDVNNQTGDILVLDLGKPNPIEQFDSSGAPKAFSALGGNNSIGPIAVGQGGWGQFSTDLAVDNSGTATQGTIYVVSGEPSTVYAFHPDGTPVGGNFPLPLSSFGFYGACGVAADAEGEIWVSDGFTAYGYTSAGVATGATKESLLACRSHFDTEKSFYTNFYSGGTRKYDSSGGVGYDLTEATGSRDLTVDPATDDVYVDNNGVEVLQINKHGITVSSFGQEDQAHGFDGLNNSEGVGFNPKTGDIYASDLASTPPRVDVFNYVAPLPPIVTGEVVREVRSAGADVRAVVTAGGGDTTYAVEYGPTTAYGSTAQGTGVARGFKRTSVFIPLSGLTPGTKYHYRVVATNSTTSTPSPDHTFTTYAYPNGGADPCPNALARQQSGTAGLLDCRAYEQVSAVDTGGYDVESNQIPNGAPIAGFPDAGKPARVAYTTSSGSIPGTGNPTAHLGDPYVATRSGDGWKTEYVGIPANGTPQVESFSSPLLGADGSLSSFAFGGPGLCQVCLPDGSQGVPIRTGSGQLVQGMAGSLKPSGAASAGYIAKRFSADGTQFLFGSTSKFEPDGNENGDISIYDRNLTTNVTSVVSKTPAGTTMTGAGIAALDISTDGGRTLVAQRVATDGKGNDYWHLYMNVGDAGSTVDVTPGATAGVLYDGMTSDGSQVFFTSADRLTADDHDNSSDIYRADVSASGAILTRVSTGTSGTGDTDACSPVSDYVHTRWNSLTSAASCDAVAIAGGGGVGVGDGTVYFLSPELLDGPANGTVDAPNLYVAQPDAAPRYVSTLESSENPPATPALRRSVKSLFSVGPGALGIAVDPDSGDFYVLKDGSGQPGDGTAVVEKFDSLGNPSNWSFSAPYISGNKLTKPGNGNFFFGGAGQIAVDNSGGPTDGYIYLTNGNTAVFKASGESLGHLDSGGCGVAVDSAGKIYTTNYYQNRRYIPIDGNPQHNTEKEMGNIGFPFGQSPCQEATDSSGALYLSSPGNFVKRFTAAQFDSSAPKGREYPAQVVGLTVDTTSDDLFINEGTRISQWNAAGEKEISGIGAGILKDSRGIWASNGHLYSSDFSTGLIYELTPIEADPDPVESNPLVVGAVDSPGVRRTADFQVAREGGVALFPSNLSLTGALNERHVEIYRSDPDGGLLCISCTPTEAVAEGDSSLASNGMSLTDDGRIFFTTKDPLVLRDAGARKDVYEWSDGDLQLISTGSSPFDATLLTAGSDGTDVYFFSREDLLGNGTGQAMKIFDARSGGGKFILPTPAPCAASDECHGPGTEAPAPQGLGTLAGTGGQHKSAKPCKKGTVKKHGKCVKKKKHKKKTTSTPLHG
jgi:hypothetical protein